MGILDYIKKQEKIASERRKKLKTGFNKLSGSLDYAILGIDSLVNLVKKWKPSRCKTEADFQNSLVKFLQDNLMHKTKKEFKIQRARGDIVIGNVAIEMKNKIDNPRIIDGVVAQCKRYQKSFKGGVILVICGATKDSDFKLLKQGLGLFSSVKVVRK